MSRGYRGNASLPRGQQIRGGVCALPAQLTDLPEIWTRLPFRRKGSLTARIQSYNSGGKGQKYTRGFLSAQAELLTLNTGQRWTCLL